MSETLIVGGNLITYIDCGSFLIIKETAKVINASKTGFAIVEYEEQPVKTGTPTSGNWLDLRCARDK